VDWLQASFGPSQFFYCIKKALLLIVRPNLRLCWPNPVHFRQNKKPYCFVSGLKDSIKKDVEAARPQDLTTPIGLTRVSEACSTAMRRASTNDFRRTPSGSSSRSPNKIAPNSFSANRNHSGNQLLVKCLTREELKEGQAKGLCFHCDEKYRPSHWCKCFFFIEAYQ
jgi:hypothetical protein